MRIEIPQWLTNVIVVCARNCWIGCYAAKYHGIKEVLIWNVIVSHVLAFHDSIGTKLFLVFESIPRIVRLIQVSVK
jgi:hypothetical protein